MNRSATARNDSHDTPAFERSNYGAIERGEFNVRLDTIVKLAAGLDITVAALCERANI